MTTTRLARDFNDIVQWDILCARRYIISHLVDEAIRWIAAVPMPDKTPTSIIEAIATTWIRPHGPVRVLIADGENGLASEETAQWLDRVSVELKTKALGEQQAEVREDQLEPLAAKFRRLLAADLRRVLAAHCRRLFAMDYEKQSRSSFLRRRLRSSRRHCT